MTRLSSRPILQFAGIVAASFLLAACGKKEAPAAAAESAPAKVYVVGTDAAWAPFESQNEKGEIVGFDIDIVKAIAAKAGFEVKFVNTPWEGIFNALAQGDRDLVVSSLTITDQRKQTMDFSDPYFDAVQLIAAKSASPVSRFADLKTLKVGVQSGTTGDEVITKLQGKTSANIKRFETLPMTFKELDAGGVDAVVADNGAVIHYVKNNPGGKFKTLTDPGFAPEQLGIAIRKGNGALQAKVNQGLAAIKADGTYDRIYAQYFGAPPAPAAPASAASR
jgi:polar amino acid transport system substrate-binding protein